MYELIVKKGNKEVVMHSSKTIFDLDCITGEYLNEEDFLNKINENLNEKFERVVIKSTTKGQEKYITDIVYANHNFNSRERIIDKYTHYLYENKDRIYGSFIYNLNRFTSNLERVTFFEILDAVSKTLNTYKQKRDCYFELVKEGYLKVPEAKQAKKEQDYLASVIDDIDSEKLGNNQEIMLEKIRTGEIEPSLYDLEDYISMQRQKKR